MAPPRRRRPRTPGAPASRPPTPTCTVNYDPIGSGDGRANFISEAFAFAGTDSALNDDEGELTAAAERCGGGNVVQVPAYVSPIAVMFNLEGVDSLNLSAEVIANIFNGTIKTWDDAAIADLNPDADPARRPDLAGAPPGRLGHHRELHLRGGGSVGGR